ncbi:hypothetical protein J2X75_003255 [Paenibacillus sp. 2003]|nr:hypothetical protein [Paenibacillus sp. 2003]
MKLKVRREIGMLIKKEKITYMVDVELDYIVDFRSDMV